MKRNWILYPALDKAQTYVGMYPDDADGQKEVAFLKTRTGA